MALSTKESWLQGPGDVKTDTVDNVPVAGQSVRIRGLAAAYSNQASSEALELKTGPRGEQTATINTGKLEVLQFAHGVIEPKFTVDEAQIIAQKYGPAFKKVIAEIDRLSGVDKEAIEEAAARFQPGVSGEAGSLVDDESSNGGG